MSLRPLTLVALLAAALPVFAADYQSGDLMIHEPWSRELPPNAPAGAAYFEVHNTGDSSDRLVSASTPRAAHSELHTHVERDGLLRMEEVPAVEVQADQRIAFRPGGLHVMLFDLQQPLKAGERFPLTLEFERAGSLTVEVEVRAADAQSSGSHGHKRH